MAWHNRIEYPVEKIRTWIKDGKTQAWIGEQLGVDAKLIYKVCKKHQIKCQRTGPRSGQGHSGWKGGRLIDKDGYVLVYSPGHPFARKPRMKYVQEHRLVMENYVGRYLTRKEVVHHKNGNKSDNQIENLELFSRNGEHLKHELSGKTPNWSEDGKRRIRKNIERVAYTRTGSIPHETEKLKNFSPNSE